MRLSKIKQVFLLLTALMIFMSVFSSKAYASAGGDDSPDTDIIIQATGGEKATSLIANATWLDGELLRIDVFNQEADEPISLAIRLSDYLSEEENSPYITIQAVDFDGNQSGIIQIRNPFYISATGTDVYGSRENQGQDSEGNRDTTTDESDLENSNISSQRPSHLRPLTPDGSGTVIDNVTDTDGVEFFTIATEDGNEFFLIVDRQRTTDNVYLLNTVTEEDLVSLAQAGGREVRPSGSVVDEGIPAPTHPTIPSDISEPDSSAEDTDREEQVDSQSSSSTFDNGILIVIAVVVVVTGGVGYYFKIYKKKKDALFTDFYDEDEDEDFDDGWGFDSDDEERR